jgi:hypothetical protein
MQVEARTTKQRTHATGISKVRGKYLNGAQAIENWAFRKVGRRGQPNYLRCRGLFFSALLGEIQEKSATVQSNADDTNSRAPDVVLGSVFVEMTVKIL